jgi:thiamine-phosphate pyrophosphorylase
MKIQAITWDGSPYSHLEQVQRLLEAGARWIQLRQKQGSFEEKKRVAVTCAEMCRKKQAILIINDDPFLCLESDASGVHLGLSDMPVPEARKLLGENFIIGGTANTPEQMASRMEQGVDYVGVGPYRETGTKENLSAILGDAGVKAAADQYREREALGLRTAPFVVIGGITAADTSRILSLGAHGIAVSSAVVGQKDIAKAYLEFLRR